MATTEGALIASTSRGMKAISDSGGALSEIFGDGMTRAPLLRLSSVTQVIRLKRWIENPENYARISATFNTSGRFARLQEIKPAIAGRMIHLRFKASSGDAMGMNMLCKGVDKTIELLKAEFPDMELLSLSGNFCTDKKVSSVNWIEGRGKSVVCEATIPQEIVEKTLKTTIGSLVDLNVNKNLVGSALAGSIGGFNAHASNIVSAVFIATGQDPAQNIESANCLTLMESRRIPPSQEGLPSREALYISCTMPSLEVGTIGGGTQLVPQAACLNFSASKEQLLH